MNALEKILRPLVVAVNSLFDKMNPRTSDMIRQTYIFLIVAICIVGAIIGFSIGKKSAKKTGIQMAETTNQIFDLDIQQGRDDASFGSLLESETSSEMKMKDTLKEAAPTREGALAEDQSRIAEPERDRHIKSTPDSIERQSLPPVPRFDDSDPFLENDTKRIEPKTVDRGRADIVDKPAQPLIDTKKLPDAEKAKPEIKKSGEDIRGPVKTKQPVKAKLKPMDKKQTVTE